MYNSPAFKLIQEYLSFPFYSHHVRKAIARVLTVMSHKQREAGKASFAGKKSIPKDFRAKKTRALRRKLTKFEASRETVRQHKKTIQSKPKVFAIKA